MRISEVQCADTRKNTGPNWGYVHRGSVQQQLLDGCHATNLAEGGTRIELLTVSYPLCRCYTLPSIIYGCKAVSQSLVFSK